MKLGFKVVDVSDAEGGLRRLGSELGEQRLVDATVSGATILVNRWKNTVSYVTGEYKRSIREKVTRRSPGNVQVTVGTDLVNPPYPWVLEYGKTIHAKNAPYLHFKTKDGNWVKVKSVTIPPKGWARRAFDESQDEVGQEIADALGDLIDREWR